MNYSRILVWLLVANLFIALTNAVVPDRLMLGKLCGLVIVFTLLIKALRSSSVDVLIGFLTIGVVGVVGIANPGDHFRVLENVSFFASTVLFFTIYRSIDNRAEMAAEIEESRRALRVCAHLACFFVIVPMALGSYVLDNEAWARAGWTNSAHNVSGDLCMIAALYVVTVNPRRAGLKDVILYFIPTLLVFATGVRTYALSILIIGLILIVHSLREWRWRWLMGLLAVPAVVTMFLTSNVYERTIQRSENQYISSNPLDAASSGRLIWWKLDYQEFVQGYNLFEQLFGRGFTFIYEFNKSHYGLYIQGHNDFLTLLLSAGIIGVVLYAIVLLRWIFKPTGGYRPLGFVALVNFLLIMWNVNVNSLYAAQQYVFAIVLINAVLIGVSVRRVSDPEEEPAQSLELQVPRPIEERI